jgi:hypothetical protein
MDVLRPEFKRQKEPMDEFIADIETHDRMVPPKR